jgi:carbon-monoxide dehydrogenase medium subunit
MATPGYVAPHSLDEAVSLLAKTPGARVLAGGQCLLVEPNRSRIAGSLLVDLRNVPGLVGIDGGTGGLTIGAMTTLAVLARHQTVVERYPALVDAVQRTGDAQLRNRATMGGSLAGTSPHAHLPAVLLMLDVSIHATGPGGARTLRAEEFFTGGQPVLGADEVLTALAIPLPAARSGMAYETYRNPATLSPICGVAVSVTLGDNGVVATSRAALARATERPARLQAVESALAGKKPADAVLKSAASAAAGAAAIARLTVHGELFASAEYQTHLTRVLTERALKRALARAAGQS